MAASTLATIRIAAPNVEGHRRLGEVVADRAQLQAFVRRRVRDFQRFHRYADVALHSGHAAVNLIEPFGCRGLLSLRSIG